MSYRTSSKDYIPTYSDFEGQRIDAEKRAAAARERGFHLGEYDITYTVNGTRYTETISAHCKAEAVETVKKNCGLVGWYPIDIDAKTRVEPNVYVK